MHDFDLSRSLPRSVSKLAKGASRAVTRSLSACCLSEGASVLDKLDKLSRSIGGRQVLPEAEQGLPDDILMLVIACFSSKRDLLGFRATCKAFNRAFNESVRTIAIHSNLLLLPRNPSSFPLLHQVTISQVPNSAAVSATVRLIAAPAAATLTALEVTNTGMPQVPAELGQLTRLTSLCITSCRLKSLAGARLHQLPRLACIDVSNNNLAELPSALGSLGGSLKKLVVSENMLTYLPESIGGLTNLQTLRASNNTLVELPDSIACLASLTTLDCSLNRLKGVPDSLTHLTNLRQLSLFAAFQHSLRNEGAETIKTLAVMSLDMPRLNLHVEEVIWHLVRMRRKQLARAREAAAEAEAL